MAIPESHSIRSHLATEKQPAHKQFLQFTCPYLLKSGDNHPEFKAYPGHFNGKKAKAEGDISTPVVEAILKGLVGKEKLGLLASGCHQFQIGMSFDVVGRLPGSAEIHFSRKM